MIFIEFFCFEFSFFSNDFFLFSNIYNWLSLFVLLWISVVILVFFFVIFFYKWNVDFIMKILNIFEKLNVLIIIYIKIYNLNVVIFG